MLLFLVSSCFPAVSFSVQASALSLSVARASAVSAALLWRLRRQELSQCHGHILLRGLWLETAEYIDGLFL